MLFSNSIFSSSVFWPFSNTTSEDKTALWHAHLFYSLNSSLKIVKEWLHSSFPWMERHLYELPIKKTSFYSFDQFWPFWLSKTCFLRTVLTRGFNRFLPRPSKTCQPWYQHCCCYFSKAFHYFISHPAPLLRPIQRLSRNWRGSEHPIGE